MALLGNIFASLTVLLVAYLTYLVSKSPIASLVTILLFRLDSGSRIYSFFGYYPNLLGNFLIATVFIFVIQFNKINAITWKHTLFLSLLVCFTILSQLTTAILIFVTLLTYCLVYEKKLNYVFVSLMVSLLFSLPWILKALPGYLGLYRSGLPADRIETFNFALYIPIMVSIGVIFISKFFPFFPKKHLSTVIFGTDWKANKDKILLLIFCGACIFGGWLTGFAEPERFYRFLPIALFPLFGLSVRELELLFSKLKNIRTYQTLNGRGRTQFSAPILLMGKLFFSVNFIRVGRF